MTPEQVTLPALRAIGDRPRLSKQLFRFARWGNPFAPERFSDPYAMFDRMTHRGPVVYSRFYRGWFVSGYDEVTDVLRSSDVRSAPVLGDLFSVRPYSQLSPRSLHSFSRWLLINDPPDHTRLRGAVNRAFAPKRIAELRPRIETITNDLLEAVADDEAVEVVDAFTAQLPIDVIGELLGLPREQWEWLRAASAEIGRLLEPFAGFDPVSMNRRFDELNEFFSALADERRASPRDDVISELVAAQDGDVLDNDEVVAMIGVLMFAGHETTTGLLGNSLVAFSRFPEQRRLLRDHPDLIDNAVEELLRYDTPAQFTGRTTVAPIRVGEHTIPSGARISLMVGAANRDGRRFTDAHLLRVDRQDPKPISFGHGIHRCLGAALARLETQVAIPALLAAFGDYAVDLDTAEWKQSHTLRGPTRLMVHRPRSARS